MVFAPNDMPVEACAPAVKKLVRSVTFYPNELRFD
jgi:hypothetical protein